MVNTLRKTALAVFIVVTILAGLFGGLAPAGAAILSHTNSIHNIHGQLAELCPPAGCWAPPVQ